MMKNWNWILGTFVVLTIIGLFLPFLITQKPWFWDLGRSDANEIGDAIGGILGPYFSFIGSCLVAYTIWLQIEQRINDELKYSIEKIRLETQGKEIKQKDYEKIIFEEINHLLKNAENKIIELNLTRPKEPFASHLYFNGYFSFVDNYSNELLKVKLFINETTEAISLFNESKIKDMAYQKIILKKIDQLFYLLGDSGLMVYNDKNRWNNDSPDFFRFESIVKFDEVKRFYGEIYNLKLNFQNEFDPEFQKDKITQLKVTLDWLSSFEVDLNKYFELKRNMPFFLDFGNRKSSDMTDIEIDIRKQMKVIEDKWRVNALNNV